MINDLLSTMFLHHCVNIFPEYVTPQKSDPSADYAEQKRNAGQMSRERAGPDARRPTTAHQPLGS